MRKFYVDFENVQCQGMYGIANLNETDEVLVLYSVNANTVKFSIVEEIRRSKAKIVLKEVAVGTPNALDFHLITYMLLDYSPDSDIYIVSKDTGYNAAISAMKSRGRHNVHRIHSLSLVPKQEQPKTPRQEINLPIIPSAQKEKTASDTTSNADTAEAAPTMTAVDTIAVTTISGETQLAEESSENVAERALQEEAPLSVSESSQTTKDRIWEIASDDCGKDIDDKTLNAIWDALSVAANKSQFYVFFQKKFGTKKGTELHRCIRKDFETMQQIYCSTKK